VTSEKCIITRDKYYIVTGKNHTHTTKKILRHTIVSTIVTGKYIGHEMLHIVL